MPAAQSAGNSPIVLLLGKDYDSLKYFHRINLPYTLKYCYFCKLPFVKETSEYIFREQLYDELLTFDCRCISVFKMILMPLDFG